MLFSNALVFNEAHCHPERNSGVAIPAMPVVTRVLLAVWYILVFNEPFNTAIFMISYV